MRPATASARQTHSARVAPPTASLSPRPASGHDLIRAAERLGAASDLPQPNWPYAAMCAASSSALPTAFRVSFGPSSPLAGRASATSPSGAIARRDRRLSATPTRLSAVSAARSPATALYANSPYTPRPSASPLAQLTPLQLPSAISDVPLFF